MNNLIRKLKESGLITSSQSLDAKFSNSHKKLEEVYPGTWDMSRSGEIYVMSEWIPFGYEHGSVTFSQDVDPSAIFSMESDLDLTNFNMQDIAFVDIETSNLSFGAGSFVFLIGLCYFTDDGIQTDLFFISHPGAEKALLEKLDLAISRFGVIGSYNGKSFDVPFLRNRSLLHQVDLTLMDKPHIDLLFYARRLWKLRVESCRLSDIEKTILNLCRDSVEIPGWMVPQLYFDYLSEKDPELLEGVFYHNKIDVVSLAALFQHLCGLLKKTRYDEKIDSRDYFSLARLYEKNGDFALAKTHYLLGFKNDPDPYSLPLFYWEYGMLLKKNGEIIEAAVYWEKSAVTGHIASCIELAMFHEHKRRDFDTALLWAQTALDNLLRHEDIENTIKWVKVEQIKHRIDRVNQKKAKYEK